MEAEEVGCYRVSNRPPASKPEVKVAMKFELTPEEISNGWTLENKADYMRRNHVVKAVYVGQ